jgi:hypothetical protein
MYSFSNYNQIIITVKNQNKTTFACAWVTLCWNVITFHLKKNGATYQRAMRTIFHDMMHITMEDYVDYILEKSITRKDHLTILENFFDRI